VYTPLGRKEQGEFALECGVRALTFFSRFFSLPYPLSKYDMVAIPDFAAGAMENWGLVTYRYRYTVYPTYRSHSGTA
jgi:aminopeptidase N